MIVCCAKIWRLRGRTSILFEDWRKLWATRKHLASFFKCWSHLFYAICRQIFNFNNKQKKNQMRPGLETSVFFCFCFFFPMFGFFVVFFLRFASKVEKKYHLVRIVPHRNCTDTCFSKMFYQYYSRSHNIASSNTSGILIRHWSKRITWKNIPQL